MFITTCCFKQITLCCGGAMVKDLTSQCGGGAFKSPCHQKRGEWVREIAMHQHRGNRTWRAPRPRSDPSSPILWPAPQSPPEQLTELISIQHLTLQQEWSAQNQDQHIGIQGADLCTPNQMNKTRTVSCPICNAHHPDCTRSFRWCVRGQIPQCSLSLKSL